MHVLVVDGKLFRRDGGKSGNCNISDGTAGSAFGERLSSNEAGRHWRGQAEARLLRIRDAGASCVLATGNLRFLAQKQTRPGILSRQLQLTYESVIVRRLRLLYAVGPGDVVRSYRHWKAGKEVVSETSRTFSSDFFEYCRRAGHAGYAVSYFGEAQTISDGSMIVENRPKRWMGSGIRYHLSQALYATSIMLTALRWRADILIIDSGTTHWALLAPIKLARTRVVGVLHNVPWPNGYKPTGRFKRVLLASEGCFWRRVANAVLSVSPECERQVRELTADARLKAVQFRAQFNRADFSAIPPPPPVGKTPFRILFAGRIERNKGVFDIVEIARLLEDFPRGSIRFDICGGGPALPELRESIRRQGLEALVETHGRLQRPDLLKFYAACHVVVVPTRSDFCEGLPMVAAEAILCRRPVITSRLSNALDVLPGALISVKPDDPESYAAAIRQIVADHDLYERLVAACSTNQEQFYDERRSLLAALEKVCGSR